jgi:hypothetical protein
MAYAQQLVDFFLTNATAFTSTGDKARWSPGYQPVNIRAVSLVITTAFTVTPAVVNFTTQPTGGSNSGISAGDIAILNILTSYVGGQVVYKDNLAKRVNPGSSVVVNCGTASTAGAADICLTVEPSWETPANNTKMQLTT